MTEFEKKVIKLINITQEDDPRIEPWMNNFWAKYMMIDIKNAYHIIVHRETGRDYTSQLVYEQCRNVIHEHIHDPSYTKMTDFERKFLKIFNESCDWQNPDEETKEFWSKYSFAGEDDESYGFSHPTCIIHRETIIKTREELDKAIEKIMMEVK